MKKLSVISLINLRNPTHFLPEKIEIVKQKGYKVSLIAFTQGERFGEIIGSVNHETRKINLQEDKLSPEIMISIGEAFKTFKF